jgi:hypothetical protein
MIVVVVLDMHLVHPMIYKCEILVIMHLIRISLVSGIYVLLVLLQPAASGSAPHKLLLPHLNATAIDLLKKPEEVAVVDNVVKGCSEEVHEAEELAGLHLLLAAVKYHIYEVTLLDHTRLVPAGLLELRLKI